MHSFSAQQQTQLADLFSPWVMRTAWRRVENWFRTGDLYDPAELLAWQADPVAHLRDLAAELADGRYRPEPFPMIPYPKKGDRTRHYTMPSVRDQVAFMAFMVLLGPFLEARMLNVSFGNRLYRPRMRHQGRWYRTPFSLGSDGVYEPFSRSYGLFRSHLQRLATDATTDNRERSRDESVREGLERPDGLSEVDPYQLPYRHAMTGGDLIYARLDMALAFPSADRTVLKQHLLHLVRTPHQGTFTAHWGRPQFPSLEHSENDDREAKPPFRNWLECPREWKHGKRRSFKIPGQPWMVLAEGDKGEQLRSLLAGYLGELIQQVSYEHWSQRPHPDSTEPNHFVPERFIDAERDATDDADHKRESAKAFDTHGLWPVGCHLPTEYLATSAFGIPTGLAISGWLLNIALTNVDEVMCEFHLKNWSKNERFFYLRFVDDIALFASSRGVLEEGLRLLRTSLRAGSPYFHLGHDKAEPESVQSFLHQLDDAARQKIPDVDVRLRVRAADHVRASSTRQFMTHMVQEISDLAEESLEESFGSAGVDRLDALIELAQRTDEDSEVAADARLSFAVGKMARAAWPAPDEMVVQSGVAVSARAYVKDVLRAAETAISNHPWRFKLWRAIVIIGLRAYLYREGHWLFDRVLPLLRWDSLSGEPGKASWERGEAVDPPDLRRPAKLSPAESLQWGRADDRRFRHRRLRVSFHRAYFWRQWAACVRALRRVADGELNAAPSSWLSYFSQADAKAALESVGVFNRAAVVLYDVDASYWRREPALWWWEGEAVRDALMAAHYPDIPLLEELGSPRAKGLRMQTSVHLAALVDVRKNESLKLLTQALKNVVGTGGDGELRLGVGPAVAATKELAILWLPQFYAPVEHVKDLRPMAELRGLTPQSQGDLLRWAAVARHGLWEAWSPPAGLEEGGPPPIPPDREWDQFQLLDAYGVLRRWLLGHGRQVYWGAFAAWFTKAPTQRKPSSFTLFQAMYNLTDSNEPIQDGMVPALETPAPLAYELARDAWATVAGGGWITPDSVVLDGETFDKLRKARRAMVPVQSEVDGPIVVIDSDAAVIEPLADLLSKVQRSNRSLPRTLTKRPKVSALVDRVPRLTASSRAPHPLFIVPAVLFRAPDYMLHQWQAAILLLWLITGGEDMLDHVYRWAPWQQPLSDRDDLRSRYVLPEHMWTFMERALGSLRLRNPRNNFDAFRAWAKSWREDPRSLLKLRNIFFNDEGDWHLLPPSTTAVVDEDALLDNLRVRMVQAHRYPLWPDRAGLSKWAEAMVGGLQGVDRRTLEPVSAELADRLIEARANARLVTADSWDSSNRQEGEGSESEAVEERVHIADQNVKRPDGRQPDHLLVLPEWYAPPEQARQLRQFVKETGIALLSGMMLRELPRTVRVTSQLRQQGPRFVVNEALLLLPDQQPHFSRHSEDTMPTRVHTFWIRKPYPASNERGLIHFLQEKSVGSPAPQWGFVGGLHWYRWQYRGWGSFTVSICSDILDTYVWHWLRGQIQHLFIPAWNTDVDLFDQMTWTRGYELYANVVTVNHGVEGGSVAWTPKSGHDKEIFRVHGAGKGLAVTVELPVKDLVKAQRHGLEWGVQRALELWRRPPQDQAIEKQYKSPAPNYRLR